MISVEVSTDYELIKNIITNPILFRLTYGQGQTVEAFSVDTTCTYYLIKDDEVVCGCFQTKEMTKMVLEGHIFILPKFWGTCIPTAAVHPMHHLAKKMGYLKIFTRVPANCVHVLKYLARINYKACGLITKGVIHNKTLVTLFLYEYEL